MRKKKKTSWKLFKRKKELLLRKKKRRAPEDELDLKTLSAGDFLRIAFGHPDSTVTFEIENRVGEGSVLAIVVEDQLFSSLRPLLRRGTKSLEGLKAKLKGSIAENPHYPGKETFRKDILIPNWRFSYEVFRRRK